MPTQAWAWHPTIINRNYLRRLAALPGVEPRRAEPDVPLMIEHMRGPEEYDKSRRHLFELGAKIGVRFQ